MSRGQEREDEDETTEAYNSRSGNENVRTDVYRSHYDPNKKKVIAWNSIPDSPLKKSTILETERILCLSEDAVSGSSSVKPQDADYSDHVPSLSDEVENQILARVSRSEYSKFLLVNKRIFTLLRTGELFKIRRQLGVGEPYVFIFATGDSSWWVFDRQFSTRRKLPDLPADPCFSSGDKESLCAGTHLIISGREIEGVVVWRYELETNSWRKGPCMINPRCLFASASSGACAFVAGGVTGTGVVLNSAERYNPDTKSWEPLPRMQERRKLCSGFYMDNKFHVIGGRNERGRGLTCGEFYDADKKAWELIPNMLDDAPVATFQSPPLVAVANNQLYSLETSSNELKVYLKRSKRWRNLGPVPVRADSHRGWGVAFKSLGNELLVIGASASMDPYFGDSMAIYTCCPDAEANNLEWRPLECGRNRLSNFIFNCSVMVT